jgi:glutamine phosphoribosylpyrophosphate amidotransferase
MSECDSEIIAVYLAEEMSKGASLEESMHKSLDELDGVFTYIAVTQDELGVAKDELAAKPLVLYESGVRFGGRFLASPEELRRLILPDARFDEYVAKRPAVKAWLESWYAAKG